MATTAQPKTFKEISKSPEYLALLKAFQKLDNSDAASRAFLGMYGAEYQEVWARKNGGLKPVRRGRTCVHRLSRSHPQCAGAELDCYPPGNDHDSLWSWKNKPVIYVYQPYGLSDSTAQKLVEYCHQMDLQFSIDAHLAWHWPGNVLLVELWRKDFDRRQLRNLYLERENGL